MTTIAVDCMGGDHGVEVTLPACRDFLDSHPDVQLVLVGLAQSLEGFSHPRASVVLATEVVAMDDPIEVALRRKKDSSMRVAVQQVKDGHAQAAVSAGNTGALMAISRYLLKTMEGIDRPAIATQLPNARGRATTVLDLGANVDCEAHHLLQFAVMGSALVSALGNVPGPSVGLLNIGEEVIKGNETIKRAGELLRAAAAAGDLNFAGNVEGNDIFNGTVDIVVCDGFVGNVALKATEGVAGMIGDFLRAEFSRNIFTRFAAVVAYVTGRESSRSRCRTLEVSQRGDLSSHRRRHRQACHHRLLKERSAGSSDLHGRIRCATGASRSRRPWRGLVAT